MQYKIGEIIVSEDCGTGGYEEFIVVNAVTLAQQQQQYVFIIGSKMGTLEMNMFMGTKRLGARRRGIDEDCNLCSFER